MNGSREIERGVGYRKYSEELSGYPTIQSAMEGGFSKRLRLHTGGGRDSDQSLTSNPPSMCSWRQLGEMYLRRVMTEHVVADSSE